MEWSIQQVAKLAGTTSRALRHYDELGLVPPARVGANGYRYYDERALVRLQRVLLLRELGLGLAQIAEVLARQTDEASALASHLELLREERARLDRQIAAVQGTIVGLEGKGRLMAEDMLDGFDHSRYREEVEARWGREAYSRGDRWWRGMSEEERARWMADAERLGRDWIAAVQDPAISAHSDAAQAIAARHVDWLRGIPGTPAAESDGDLEGYVLGLAEMYVADERFARNYGGREGAAFVRDALRAYLLQSV